MSFTDVLRELGCSIESEGILFGEDRCLEHKKERERESMSNVNYLISCGAGAIQEKACHSIEIAASGTHHIQQRYPRTHRGSTRVQKVLAAFSDR